MKNRGKYTGAKRDLPWSHFDYLIVPKSFISRYDASTFSLNSTAMLTYFMIAGVLAIIIAVHFTTRGKDFRRLPPGPPGEPILGNARQIPSESSWLYYTTLKKEYGM